MGQHRHAEMLHDATEDSALRDRTIVRIDRRRNALERRAVLFRLRRHGIEQKTQRCLDILAVNSMVFLVGTPLRSSTTL
jgi:hypothetical protein